MTTKTFKQSVPVWRIWYKMPNLEFHYEDIMDILEFGSIIISNQWRDENPQKDFFKIEFNGFKTN